MYNNKTKYSAFLVYESRLVDNLDPFLSNLTNAVYFTFITFNECVYLKLNMLSTTWKTRSSHYSSE